MPEISLTDFVDFVISSGTPKLTKVRQVKNRDDYNPAFDFWKRFRKGLVKWHESGSILKSDLNKVATGQTDKKKQTAYPAAVKGYKKWLGKKNYSWCSPPREMWTASGLSVRVNPEVGLDVSGVRHVLKLYMKSDPLSKRRADTILALMHDALSSHCPPSTEFCIVDVPRGKCFCTSSGDAQVTILLQGEAASFALIWEALP